MHIPDGFLAPNAWVPTWAIAIGWISYCLKKTRSILNDKTIPLMGVMSAFIFAAQMVNFPIAGGTSGHLLGGVLAGVLLGPYTGSLVIAVVLSAQCLIFQDGGITALGANIVNMSLIGTGGGYLIYKLINSIWSGPAGKKIGVVTASWFSVLLAATACSLELAFSGTIPLKVVLAAMVGVHAVIGVGEAIITFLVWSYVMKVRADLLYSYQLMGVNHE
ncbi:MAG: energy-coupling factor ABC transporter permease [bacterium]|nr:energy-coupling factor ABC transporter permease [bacterium]MDD5756732.1 energy-coupling factor ABC transporter permease [bacterium]